MMTPESFALGYYEEDSIAQAYGTRASILSAEHALLKKFEHQIGGRRVLDVGCGGGRTSIVLSELASEYVGLDYAASMIRICQQRYPALTFMQGDATVLSQFEDSSMDFVLFSYNGIDTMSHSMRLNVFAAVSRVLRPDGLFAFSSHNRDFAHLVRSVDFRAGFSPNAIRSNVKNLISFLKVRGLEKVTAEYAILSDPRCGFCQLNYFISKQRQVEQLQEHGYEVAGIFDWNGELVEAALPDSHSMSIYYVCRKPTVRHTSL